MEGRARVIVFVLFVPLLVSCPSLVAAQQQTQTSPPASSGSQQGATEVRDQLQQLRHEFDTLRQDYETRMTALETRLAALEQPQAAGAQPAMPAGAQPVPPPATTPTTAPAATPPTAEQQPPAAQPATPPPAPGEPAPEAAGQQAQTAVPSGAAGAGGPEGALPVYSNQAGSSKVFNPDIAVIGNFLGAAGKNSIEERPPLALDEAELSFQAVVDPYARADFFLTGGADGVGVEEGYLTLTALPGGFLMKIGKMKANFGKTNTLHPHQLPWVDQPLVLNNLLGSSDGLNDSGISVSKLLMNPWLFLEATGEVFAGNNNTFKSYQRSDLTYVGRLHGYRDLTEGSNVDLGASFAYGHNELGESGQTRLYGFDATLRYRPLRRAIYHRLLARSEFMWNQSNTASGNPFATSFGMYAGGEYQFARRWFAGARYDWSDRRFQPTLHDSGGSLLLTYWPSEFSQVRGQYRRMRYAENVTANELLFQFQFAIGAHGAHTF